MGYEVNYNEVDYADAAQAVQHGYAQLQQVQSLLLAAAQRAGQCQEEVALRAAAAGVPAQLAALEALAARLRDGYQQAGLAVLDARRLQEKTGAAMENYQRAEAVVEKVMHSVQAGNFVVPFLRDLAANGNRPPRERMETLLRLLMLANPYFLFNGQGLQESVDDTTRWLTGLLQAVPRDYDSQLLLDSGMAPEQFEAQGTLQDYYRLHQQLQQAPDGQIMVVQVDPQTYAVFIPGTQEGMGGPNPFDTLGIVDGFARDSENYVQPIDEALRRSGAEEGDEVVLSGYSQGGIHAANLLGSKLLRKKYKLDKMLTLGSPIGNIDLPDEVKSLSLEDAKDMVPGTDGGPNRHRKRQWTVTFDGPREQIKDQLPTDGIFGAPHNLRNYGDHLAELDAAPEAELRRQRELFLLPKGPLKLHRFTLRRKQEPVPRYQKQKQEPGKPYLQQIPKGN